MPATVVKFYSYNSYILYDGTNGAAIVAQYNDPTWNVYTGGAIASLVSESGGVAVLHFTNVDYGDITFTGNTTLHTGDYLPVNTNPTVITAVRLGQFETALTSTPAVPASVKYGAYGEALLGALSVGSNNLAVTIKPTQPDTGYVASAFLDGPTLALGTVSLGTPVKTSTSVVTVPVINSGVLPITLSQATITVNVTAPQS